MSDDEFRRQLDQHMAELHAKVEGTPTPNLKIGLTDEMFKSLQDKAEMLVRQQKQRIMARERLTALLSDDLQPEGPVAAEAYRRVVGVLGALLGVEVREGEGQT